jgi:hypothetical protein
MVASHVLEHMRIDEVLELSLAWDVRSVYVDVPVWSTPSWDGYEGTHIIEAGYEDILGAIEAAGFSTVEMFSYGLAYRPTPEPLGFVAYLERT